MMRLTVLLITLVALFTGCSHTPHNLPNATYYDADTQYSVEERPNGFAVTIAKSHYQFVPRTGAMWYECKSAVMAIAHDVAERRGRTIEPLDEQRIRIAVDRNGLTGITSCSATTVARWK